MKNKIIRSKKEYEKALIRLEQIFDAKEGTNEADELNKLAQLIEQYEDKHFPLDLFEPTKLKNNKKVKIKA